MILSLVLGVVLLIINYTLAKRLFKNEFCSPYSSIKHLVEIDELLKEDFEINYRLGRIEVMRIVILFVAIITLIPYFGLILQLTLNITIWALVIFGQIYFIPRKPKNRIKFYKIKKWLTSQTK